MTRKKATCIIGEARQALIMYIVPMAKAHPGIERERKTLEAMIGIAGTVKASIRSFYKSNWQAILPLPCKFYVYIFIQYSVTK